MNNQIFNPEIRYEDGVPLAPNIAPVIILQGSDYNLGYQYAQQVNQIFGSWALERLKRKFSGTEESVLKAFHDQVEKFTPEFIDINRGIAAGATEAGVTLSYEEVLADSCMTFNVPPAFRGLGRQEKQSNNDHAPACSGFAAWGRAARDGKLIACGSGDHPLAFELIGIVLPEVGNSYIIRLGIPTFSTHPAMNNKGLAYAHHGAGSIGNEPQNQGLFGSLVVQHTLRFANNLAEALEMQMAYPPGSQAAGLWADVGGEAAILECRNPRMVRKAGDLGERDFLFSTNNSLIPELEPFLQNRFGWKLDFIPHGGWNLDDGNSIRRNLCMWNALHNYHGAIDLKFAKMLWRFPSPPPDSPTLQEADKKLYETKGLGRDVHIGNLGNGMVGLMLPDKGDKGLYYACVGPAGRQAEPLTVDWHYYHIAATHTFFELQLAANPLEIVKAAKKQAQYDLYHANRELCKLTYHDAAYAPLDTVFDKAATENQKGDYYLGLTKNASGNDLVCFQAKALRAFTRCQAYAQQVYESLIPPHSKPTDLGLGEWFGQWGQWESYSPYPESKNQK
jgi:hypothetical protein